MIITNLSGKWGFHLDTEKLGVKNRFYNTVFNDSIILPSTVSESKKGTPSDIKNEGYLTDPYESSGYAWYSRNIELAVNNNKIYTLFLERTRVSHLWINGEYVGTQNSSCTSHSYDITPHLNKEGNQCITIMTDNSDYPISGGHMTSPDTQTNWNGITGAIYIEEKNSIYLSNLRIFTNIEDGTITAEIKLHGSDRCSATFNIVGHCNEMHELKGGNNTILLYTGGKLEKWSEFNPVTYSLEITLNCEEPDKYNIPFGMRSFLPAGKYFEVNGEKTFLRGKHDGIIFPMTGYAPTSVDEWIKVMSVSKRYGINHYRFHTCCPPDAAFTAADMLGIYMEPELTFWGTFTDKGDDGHDEAAMSYLVEEGFRILDAFGNHPSFVMLSIGNELWGNHNRINQVMGDYKAHDSRHLYTQGSNSFQFVPCILENDDFFCGVRFSPDRLFRGSYASCDARGHIQYAAPTSAFSYNEKIRPQKMPISNKSLGGEISIQYGTGVKTVYAESGSEIYPNIPVISHEVGQYAMYPDFKEIEKFTGVLKARNYEIFRERLEKAGMLEMAESFFKASGRFVAECYKAEIETAMRSCELAGFQLLDLQDFTGQGTALVGILDAFMDNKGAISESEWRQFCSDTVVLAEFETFVVKGGESVHVNIKMHRFCTGVVENPEVYINIKCTNQTIYSENTICRGVYSRGVYELCSFDIDVPDILGMAVIETGIKNTDIRNSYELWIYPNEKAVDKDTCKVVHNYRSALAAIKNSDSVLYFPECNADNSLEAEYCTDFWNYHMFNSISVERGAKVPVGTHGLLINSKHPALTDFPTKEYSTPQWYDIVTASRSFILDDTDLVPIVQTIDNFERNHRLGMIFEFKVNQAKILVCTSKLENRTLSEKQLYQSLQKYVCSYKFEPVNELSEEKFTKIFR